MKKWWKKHRYTIFRAISRPFVKSYLSLVRVEVVHQENIQNLECSMLVSGLHKNGLAAVHCFRNNQYLVMVSHSRDGDLQSHLYSGFGFRIVRGSTSKGGDRATIECIRLLRSEKCGILMAVDGPTGPKEIVKGGTVLMAKKSGAALIPCGFSATRFWTLKSWDGFMVPKPFSKVKCVLGEPIYVSPEASEDEFELVRLKLQNLILEREIDASIACGHGG